MKKRDLKKNQKSVTLSELGATVIMGTQRTGTASFEEPKIFPQRVYLGTPRRGM